MSWCCNYPFVCCDLPDEGEPKHRFVFDACELSASLGGMTTTLHGDTYCEDGVGLVFDGDRDYASMSPALQMFGPDITLAVWVYYESDAHAVSPLLDLENPGSEIFLGDFPYIILHSNSRVSATDAAPTNEWIHVAATAGSGEMKIYINGELSAAASATVTQASRNDLWIGRNTHSDTYLHGKIKSIEIWKRALDSTEVRKLYNGDGDEDEDGAGGGGNGGDGGDGDNSSDAALGLRASLLAALAALAAYAL
jgi:hypothetical protein